jgi:hypothetical protein
MPKSVPEGFNAFLPRLVPLQSEHDKAISHKDSVERNLINNFKCSRFFETGSFGNDTGVRHYSDTDYFAVMPADYLHQDSSYDLTKVRNSLQYTFPRTEGIKVSCPAVRVPFGNYASETMEVTPCCFGGLVETPLGKVRRYQIPDCSGGWMFSSPEAHNAYVGSIDDKLSNQVKPLIQLVKAWKYYNNVPIKSFYLELRVTRYAEDESSIIYDIDLRRIFNSLYNHELASMRDPMGISGLIPACKTDTMKEEALSKLKTAVTRAEKAVEAKDKGDIDNAFHYWNLLFNDHFPAR